MLLQDPRHAYVTSNQHVVFFDGSAGLIDVDSLGNLVAELGQLGHEPGQYRRVTALADVDGAVTIWDAELSRVTQFRTPSARSGWVRRSPDDVRIGPSGVFGLEAAPAASAGDSTRATITSISSAGKLGAPLFSVWALATRREGSDMVEVPSLIWRTPVWDVLADGRIVYIPFGRDVRIEVYDTTGAPSLLITGSLPFALEPITPTRVAQLEGAFFRSIFQRSLDSVRVRCDSLRHLPTPRSPVECETMDYVKRKGTRLPAAFPPLVAVTRLTGGGFGVGTSHVDQGLTTWLLVDARGAIIGRLGLRSSERIIGGTARKLAVADTAHGHVAVTWQQVVK